MKSGALLLKLAVTAAVRSPWLARARLRRTQARAAFRR